MNRFLRIITAISFLTVIIPGEKLAIPVGLLLISPFLGISPSNEILTAVFPLVSVIYLFVSAMITLNRKWDHILQAICIAVFWIFLLLFVNSFRKYSDTITLISLLLFVSASTVGLIRTINAIRRFPGKG